MIKKEKTFKYEIGKVIGVGDPICNFYIKNCTIIQHVQPLEFPVGNYNPRNIVLFPSVRNKMYRPTRKISYLLQMAPDPNFKDDITLYIWATEDCIKLQ